MYHTFFSQLYRYSSYRWVGSRTVYLSVQCSRALLQLYSFSDHSHETDLRISILLIVIYVDAVFPIEDE